MKFLSYITAFLVMAGSTCFGQGMRISAYPNTNNLGFSNLFIVAIKGSPGTNMNISWQQLSNLISTTVGGQFILENSGVGTNTAIYNSLTVTGSNTITGNQIINGKVGIGTNAPDATFHVTGNNAQNVIQAGTSNRPSLAVLNTNGNFTVQGDIGASNINVTNVYADWFFVKTNHSTNLIVAGLAQTGTLTASNGTITNLTAITLGVSNNVTASNVWDRCNMLYWGATNDIGLLISNALLAGCSRVIVPAGVWTMTTPIIILTNNTEIQGYGKGTYIYWNGTPGTFAFTVGNGTDQITGCKIADLSLNGGQLGGSGIKLRSNAILKNEIYHVYTYGLSNHISIGNAGAAPSYDNSIINSYVSVSQAEIGIDLVDSCHNTVIDNCVIRGFLDMANTAIGLRASGSSGIQVSHCNIEGCGIAGIQTTNLNGSVNKLSIAQCYMEALSSGGVNIDLGVETYYTGMEDIFFSDSTTPSEYAIRINNGANYVSIESCVFVGQNTAAIENADTDTSNIILKNNSYSTKIAAFQNGIPYDLSSGGKLGLGGATNAANYLHVLDTTVDVTATQITLEGRTGGYGSGISLSTRRSDGAQILSEQATIHAEGVGAWNSAAQASSRLVFRTRNANTLGERVTVMNNGLVGIGSNAPAATLHVTGNNVQNVAQFGTTNKPEQVVISTNGVLSVNPGGGLNPAGCYGFLGMNDTNLITCAGAAGVYTNVAGNDGFTTITTNGFFGNTAAIVAGLTNLNAGYYRVTICMSGQGANNQAIEGEVFTNGVACDLIGFKKTYDAASRMDDMSMTGIIYLPANCGTQFMVQDGGTGGDIIVHRASLTIGTP